MKKTTAFKTSVSLAAIVFLLGAPAALADNGNHEGGDHENRIEHRGSFNGFLNIFGDKHGEERDEGDNNDNQGDDDQFDQEDFSGADEIDMTTATPRIFDGITGTGQPVIGGTITAISGNTLTVKTATNAVYSVDASGAKIAQIGVDQATVSNLKVGDSVVVQGTVNGSAVVASSVIDHSAPASVTLHGDAEARSGIFHAISNFFARLFGF